MDLGAFWKLLGIGMEADFKERRYTIRLGPITIKGLPFERVKALRSNQPAIESLLSRHFVQRGVMWEDFRHEKVKDCIRSLRVLQKLSETQASAFEATKKPEDQIFSSILQAWANECDKAARHLELASEDERDPINTGLDMSAQEWILDVLSDFRKATYPSVQMFIDLLPDTSPVKAQAAERLRYGKDILVKFYNVSTNDLTSPEIERTQRKIIAESQAKRFAVEAQQYRAQYNAYLNTKRKIDAEIEQAGPEADGTRLAQHVLDFYGVSRRFYRENNPLLQSPGLDQKFALVQDLIDGGTLNDRTNPERYNNLKLACETSVEIFQILYDKSVRS